MSEGDQVTPLSEQQQRNERIGIVVGPTQTREVEYVARFFDPVNPLGNDVVQMGHLLLRQNRRSLVVPAIAEIRRIKKDYYANTTGLNLEEHRAPKGIQIWIAEMYNRLIETRPDFQPSWLIHDNQSSDMFISPSVLIGGLRRIEYMVMATAQSKGDQITFLDAMDPYIWEQTEGKRLRPEFRLKGRPVQPQKNN